MTLFTLKNLNDDAMLKCRKYRLSMSSSGETVKLWGYYTAGTVVQKTDYYPYGSPMASSTGEEVNRYKFGEKEYETRLGLNFHNFEARMLFNDRLAFNRPDDLAGNTPWLSPYIYCAANPIKYIDPTGKELTVSGSTPFQQNVRDALLYLGDRYQKLKNTFKSSPNMIFIHESLGATRCNTKMCRTESGTKYIKIDIHWNPYTETLLPTGEVQSAAVGLSHEMDHAELADKDYDEYLKGVSEKDPIFNNKEDLRVILGPEKSVADRLGEPVRYSHKGQTIKNQENITNHTRKYDPHKLVDIFRSITEHLLNCTGSTNPEMGIR